MDVGLGARRESVKACLWFQDVNIISAVRYAMLFNLPPLFKHCTQRPKAHPLRKMPIRASMHR